MPDVLFWFLDDVELWIVMTSIVSGAIMYTVMVANTAAMMSDVDITARAYKNKVLGNKYLDKATY